MGRRDGRCSTSKCRIRQLMIDREECKFEPIGYPQLVKNVADVMLHSLLTDRAPCAMSGFEYPATTMTMISSSRAVRPKSLVRVPPSAGEAKLRNALTRSETAFTPNPIFARHHTSNAVEQSLRRGFLQNDAVGPEFQSQNQRRCLDGKRGKKSAGLRRLKKASSRRTSIPSCRGIDKSIRIKSWLRLSRQCDQHLSVRCLADHLKSRTVCSSFRRPSREEYMVVRNQDPNWIRDLFDYRLHRGSPLVERALDHV